MPMVRLLALNALLFLLPFALYAGWVRLRRGRFPLRDEWPLRIVLILGVAGAVFMIVGLVLVALEPAEAAFLAKAANA